MKVPLWKTKWKKRWRLDGGLRCCEIEVHPPGPPRRPASEMHLRPKPDHVSRTGFEVFSPLRLFRPGREEARGGGAAVALHKGVTKKNTTDNTFNSLCGRTVFRFSHSNKKQKEENNRRRSAGQVTLCVEPIPRLVFGCFPAGPLLPQRPQINQPIYSLLSHCNGDGERQAAMPVAENHGNIHMMTLAPIYGGHCRTYYICNVPTKSPKWLIIQLYLYYTSVNCIYKVWAPLLDWMYPGLSAHRGPERSSARGSAGLLSIYEKLAGKDIDRTN